MDEVWPWLASLPPAGTGAGTSSFPLAASPEDDGASIVLQAGCTTSDGGTAESVAFSIAIDSATGVPRVLWTSEPFAAAASDVAPRLQLLAQLIDELTALSPSITSLGREPDAASPSESNLPDAEVVSAVIATTGAADGSALFSLALLMRVFWLCALERPADLGFLFFQALGEDIGRALRGCAPAALGALLLAVGPDVEERFMRSLGYMVAKWCLLREMQPPPKSPPPKPDVACLSYATKVHGLWMLRGYAPVLVMRRVAGASPTITALPHELPEEPALRYGLVHQQLEAVAQVEYAVSMRGDGFIVVGARVDNIRVRVVRLGYRKSGGAGGNGADEEDVDDGDDHVLDGERHFPSRIRLWVGPRFGSSYATGPSLGRSTGNPEREVETTRTVKGGATKLGGDPRVKAKMRSSSRVRNRSWRWEQEAEGSAGVFEGVLCDPVTGTEVAAWRPGSRDADPRSGMRRRYGGPGRAFSKMRGLVVAGDELPEEVTWRVGREAEGRTVRWRMGLKVWLSYLPNEVRSRHFETRCVEWTHEVELPIMATTAS